MRAQQRGIAVEVFSDLHARRRVAAARLLKPGADDRDAGPAGLVFAQHDRDGRLCLGRGLEHARKEEALFLSVVAAVREPARELDHLLDGVHVYVVAGPDALGGALHGHHHHADEGVLLDQDRGG